MVFDSTTKAFTMEVPEWITTHEGTKKVFKNATELGMGLPLIFFFLHQLEVVARFPK